jgi:small-conductance mechanosensitive channel
MPTLHSLDGVFDTWRDHTAKWLQNEAPRFLVILIVAWLLVRLLRIATRKLEAFSHNHPAHSGLRAQQLRTLASVISSVGAVVIYFLAGMQVLPLFGIDARPILASAGIVGLAVGFGAQTLVKDVINGFFVLFENQYDIGDVVKLAGVSGTVEHMTLRHTLLRDANGTVHLIPNSVITVVSNLTRDWSQVMLTVETDYNEDSERIAKLLREVGEEIYHDDNFADVFVAQPEVPGIERVSGHEMEFLMTAKVKPGQQWRVARDLRRRIKQCFDKAGVRMPAPARTFITDPSAEGGKKEVT